MKIVFLSTLAFDANISLINALRKDCDVYFFTEALYEVYNFINKENLSKHISSGTEVEEIQRFSQLINLEKTYVINGVRNLNIIKKLSASFKIHKIIKKINPDLIIIDNYMLTYLFSALTFRKKTLLIVHDPFLHTGENFLVDKYLRKLYFSLVKNKMLLNKNQKEAFTEFYKEKSNTIHTSFLSVYEYLTFFSGYNDFEKDDFNVLFFGRISPYKGIKYLLDAFVKILSSDKKRKITLTIAGSGDFDFDISKYENYHQITIVNRFILPEELAKLISQSSVVICPYTDATQSGVIMSAYAFKKPVIATNVGGLPEMVEDGKTGLIIEPKSIDAIYNAILQVYDNQNVLSFFSENIEKDYFLGKKSWRSSADQFLEAFNKIKNNK